MYVVKYSSQYCHSAALQPVESLTDLYQLSNTQMYSVMAGGSATHSLFHSVISPIWQQPTFNLSWLDFDWSVLEWGVSAEWCHFQGGFLILSEMELYHISLFWSVYELFRNSWPPDPVTIHRVRVNDFIVTHGWSVSPKGVSLPHMFLAGTWKAGMSALAALKLYGVGSCLHCLHLMFFPHNLIRRLFFFPLVYLQNVTSMSLIAGSV